MRSRLSDAGYQPLGRSARSCCGSPRERACEGGPRRRSASWVGLFREMDGNPAAQAAIRDPPPRLSGRACSSSASRRALARRRSTRLLRSALIADLGYLGEPHVIAESQRLFARLAERSQGDSRLAQGQLARRHRPQRRRSRRGTRSAPDRCGTRGPVERSRYYQLLGAAKRRRTGPAALDLAITKEPGATVSAAIITAAAEKHPLLAFDFVLVASAAGRPADRPFRRARGSSRDWSPDSGDASLIAEAPGLCRRHTSKPDRPASGRPCDRPHPIESATMPRIQQRGGRMAEVAPADLGQNAVDCARNIPL